MWANTTRFIESDTVPHDAKVVDRTWRFVNKNGDPDRRFNNNHEIPVCLYGELALGTETGLTEILHISPKLILTLGNTPLKALFALAGAKPPVIGQAHGTIQTLAIEGETFSVIPLYHPASGIYNRSLVEVMEQDAAYVGEIAKTLEK